MDKKIIGVLLLTFSINIAYTQHNISFNAGVTKALNNLYFSKGLNLNLGYQFDFAQKLVWRTSVGLTALKQNVNYAYSDEPTIDQQSMLISGMSPEIFFTNFELKSSLGVILFKKHRIQPVFLSGLSFNYSLHSYGYPDSTPTTTSLTLRQKNQYNLGFQGCGGLILRISGRFRLQTYAEYSWLPFCKTGIQELNIKMLNYQFGVIIGL